MENYLQRYDANEMVLCTLGDLYQRNGEYEKAVDWYYQALALQVDITDMELHCPAYANFLPWVGLGKAFIRLERYEEAAHALKKAEKIHPQYPELKILKFYLKSSDRI